MVDSFELAASLAASIAAGITIGIIIQNVVLKHGLLLEKKRRLSPYLERALSIIDKICRHSEHATIAIGRKDWHFGASLASLAWDFAEYDQWYTKLGTEGMIIELRSIDAELSGYFVGLFNYAQNCNESEAYLQRNIRQISDYSKTCRSHLLDWFSK